MSKQKIKTCLICGKDITGTKQIKICTNEDCKKKWKILKYHIKKFKHTCKNCGKDFITIGEGEKRTLCDTCKNTRKIYNYKRIITQNVICPKCNKILYTQIKHGSSAKEIIKGHVCSDCKILNKQNLSIKMKLNNPSYKHELTIEEYNNKQNLKTKYRSEIEIKKLQNRDATSKRMKLNNPMKNPDIVNKAKNTLKKHLLNGTLIYKRGIQRTSFKGSRTIMQYFRFSLKEWRKQNLNRTNYTCEICNKHGENLHIHHTEPLNEIITKLADKFNIELFNLKYGSDDFINIEKECILYHNTHNIGLVVCPDCHAKVDKHYHKGKGNGGYRNEIKENK